MKKTGKKLLIGLLSALMICLMSGAVFAASLVQTGATQNSVTVTWNDLSDSGYYTISNVKALIGTDSKTLKEAASLANNATSCTITGLTPGTEYIVRVTYTRTRNSYSYDSYCYGSDIKTMPGKVTNLHQEKWYYYVLSFQASWDKQTGVDGYEYIVQNSKGKKVASEKYKYNYNEFSVKDISNSMIYTGQVRAYTVFNGKTYYGDWSNVAYFFTQPRLKTLKVTGNKLKISWGKVSGATGYDIYVSTKAKTGYKKVKSVKASKNSVTISKLNGKKFNKKKAYYAYVVTKKGKNTSGKLYYWSSKKSLSSLLYLD